MKQIRKWLLLLFGLRSYLRIVSRIYMVFIRLGFFRNKYPELFYLRKLIRPGDVCIDIGANLGYYSAEMGRLAGARGKVLAVEPVALFGDILEKNLSFFRLKNMVLYPVALGKEEGKVRMGTPEINGVFRHGLTKVIEREDPSLSRTYEVDMKNPGILFGNLERLDFIKCDVEGYEAEIFPHFMAILDKFRPLIQIEISGDKNKQLLYGLLEGIGYEVHTLQHGKLVKISKEEMMASEGQDFYFKYKTF